MSFQLRGIEKLNGNRKASRFISISDIGEFQIEKSAQDGHCAKIFFTSVKNFISKMQAITRWKVLLKNGYLYWTWHNEKYNLLNTFLEVSSWKRELKNFYIHTCLFFFCRKASSWFYLYNVSVQNVHFYRKLFVSLLIHFFFLFLSLFLFF